MWPQKPLGNCTAALVGVTVKLVKHALTAHSSSFNSIWSGERTIECFRARVASMKSVFQTLAEQLNGTLKNIAK